MKIAFKELSFLFAWISLIVFGTLVLGYDPILEKSLYLSVAIICELWIVFRLPGSRSLWIFPKNATYASYREIRIISALFLWFLMLAVPKGFDLFCYYVFALCIERIIFFCSSQKKERILQKVFPPYKKYGIPALISLIIGFFLILFFNFLIGTIIANRIL
jgi:hypothetical protein